MVAALPLLVLPVDKAVGRRCRSAGAVRSIGVDAEVDRVDDGGSGEERAVWKASVNTDEDGVRYTEAVVLIEDILLNLPFMDFVVDRRRSTGLCLVLSVGELRGLMSMDGDLWTCIGYEVGGVVDVVEGGESREGISSARK